MAERLRLILLAAVVFPAMACFAQRGAPIRTGSPESIEHYSHAVWKTEDGLPENSVTAIAQTGDGYIWLGTPEGLVRFDGINFTVFDRGNTEAISSNRITSLLSEGEGDLWIGTEDGGLLLMKGGKFHAFSAADGLPSSSISTIYRDHEGSIWIGTSGGGLCNLIKADSSGIKYKFRVLNSINGLSNNVIRAICEDNEGNLWVGTGGGGLNRFRDGKFKCFTKADGLLSDAVWSLCLDKKGVLWIGTAAGLMRMQHGAFGLFNGTNGLSHNFVWSLFARRDTSLLIGTQGGGLDELREGVISNYDTREGLSDDFVWSVYEDNEENIWIGTNGGGLNLLRQGIFTSYTSAEGLANDIVWSVCEDKEKCLWIGTYSGLNRFEPDLQKGYGGRFRTYTTGDGLANDFVWSVYPGREGSIWIGTAEGMNLFKDGKFKTYGTPDGLPGNTVKTFYEETGGTLWIGTTDGLCRFQEGKFKSYTVEDGLADNNITDIKKDKEGTLWIGTAGGLSRFKPGDARFVSYGIKDGLLNVDVRSLFIDADGTVWIGTQGGGLYSFRGDRFTACTSRNGLFADAISQILPDDSGYIWMSSNKGIFRVSRNELSAFVDGKTTTFVSTSYGEADGMVSRECNGSSQPAGWKSADGKLWFPTIKGIVGVNPRRLKINTVPPPVVIQQVIIDGNRIFPDQRIEMAHGRGELEVDYTALSYVAPEKVQFKYRLEGFDKSWVSVGNRRTAYYTNLPPGEYRFTVIACNNDGIWNETGRSLNFSLSPKFHERFWFYALCALAVSAAGFGIYRLRIRQLRERQLELLRLVEERTKSLQEEKEKADKARGEAERQREIAQEANRLKTELLNIVAHDLKSPLVTVKLFAKIILDGVGSHSQTNEFSTHIFNAAERMHVLIEELLESAAIENGNMVLDKKRVDLSKLAGLVVAENQLSAGKKEQKIEYTYDPNCAADGDENRLREAIDNLVSNAVKFSPPGKDISVACKNGGKVARIEVRDSGPGLTEGDKLKVFGKFQRLSAQPTGWEPSSGLGLSIVKQLIELHKGKVWVESEAGKGSLFIIELPRT